MCGRAISCLAQCHISRVAASRGPTKPLACDYENRRTVREPRRRIARLTLWPPLRYSCAAHSHALAFMIYAGSPIFR